MPLKALGLFLVALTFEGMSCSEHRSTPALSTIRLNEIHLIMADPASGKPGIFLSWSKPVDGKVSYYEIYQSFNRDSLGHSLVTLAAKDTPSTVVILPDSTLPKTIYYAVRSIWVEPTGQKLVSDTLPVDSITVLPSFTILIPPTGSIQKGREILIELQTHSDPGILLNLSIFEKHIETWSLVQRACLPHGSCETPIFGAASVKDTLTLQDVPANESPLPSLLCLDGTESFQGNLTGLRQSMGCSRYLRVSQ